MRNIASCAFAGNAGNVFPATAVERFRHASRHVRHARAVMHTGIANYRFPMKSLAGKRSRRMRSPQFYVSGKRPMTCIYAADGKPLSAPSTNMDLL